jgi:hypothetical protein
MKHLHVLTLVLGVFLTGCCHQARTGPGGPGALISERPERLWTQALQARAFDFAMGAGDTRRTLYQPVANGMALNLEDYKGALAGAGSSHSDLRIRRREASLVDQLPRPLPYFAPSQRSVENAYEFIIDNAVVVLGPPAQDKAPLSQNPAVGQLLIEARTLFDMTKNPPFELSTRPSWHAVELSPETWASASAPFVHLELEGPARESETSPPADVPFAALEIALESALRQAPCRMSISFDILLVHVKRSWMRMDLFELSGWALGSEEPGKVSRGIGAEDSPDALLPLVPIGFVVVKNLSVVTQKRRGATPEVTPVAGTFVVGFLSEKLPFSPLH